MANFELNKFGNPQALATTVAQEWLRALQASGSVSGAYSVALAGGRIAGTFFDAVSKLAQNQREALETVHFFWGDERCVPPDSAESNFALARDQLLTPLSIPDSRIHRVHGERPPELAATEAERALRGFAAASHDGQPVLDLIFLGMGEDGHVASLFPGEPLETMTDKRVYRPVIGPKPPPKRITLGYAAIAAAREVWVLVSGHGKQEAFHDSLSETGTTPLARVLKLRRYTRVFTDLE